MSARAVAALVFLGTLATRVPFATSHLYAWDSSLYARALEHGFRVTADPATESPHPPGYIFYVALAALARLVTNDSNAALVAVSILASALAAAAFYLVARRIADPSVALVAAIAFALSPVVWLYSEVAYPYTVLALLSLVIGWWLVDGRRPLLASLALGIATGFRTDLLIVLGLLWLWRLAPLGARRVASAIALFALGALAWIVPTVALSGGPSAYWSALTEQSATVTGGSLPLSGAAVLSFNFVLVGEGLFWGLCPFGLIIVADGAWLLFRRAAGRPRGMAFALVLWILPALLFYLFIHIGEWGYVLSILPPLFLAATLRTEAARPRIGARAWAVLAVVSILLPAALFIGGGTRFSAERLRQRDRELSSSIVRVEPEHRHTMDT